VIAGMGSLSSGAQLAEPGLPSGDSGKAVVSHEAIQAWVSLLREDLNCSREVNTTRPDELMLTGQCALDGTSRRQTHRPASVLYKIEEVAGRRWLVRRQAAMDVLTNQNIQRDLVSAGVRRFEVSRSGDGDGIGSDAGGLDKGGPGGRASWRLRAWTDDGDEPVIDRIITAHPNGGP
jgi:uncharacterized membrane protein YgcG